eukprot:CAMPEP_0181301436 /NCGR_PEP_ID=MMETSP1101-20121128/7424_1 /TAXON_ID=46948 /ORGANISM="Rhodomonas abbreviata, Strain Caron Lab Isolate" /LENGTH=621 /DNA_ID=CAMNT_0023406743 /DNA_START=76 /DNA_END=1937 /DNA_ORIENTATION=-
MAPVAGGGGGGGLFVDHKKGEIQEIKGLLRDSSVDKDPKQKRAIMEKVVGYMTLGIDMSPLFSEMIMATATKDLVQKKMCYLYLSNYAEQQAELALLVINTLQKDSRDEDPMVRGLALRCLCSLNVNNTLEYLVDPVIKGLSDASPYVRKTAVMCVLRLRELSAELVVDRGLVAKIATLLNDRDPQVVANSVHALLSLQGRKGLSKLIDKSMTVKLLKRLHDFNEWSQCLILQVVGDFKPASDDEMFEVMNFLDERLRHNNSAVVLAASKVFIKLTASKPEVKNHVLMRVKGPLLTLMTGGSAEVAYTLLAHILLLAHKSPAVFEDDHAAFFPRYSDPNHVQGLKIQVLCNIATEKNHRAIIQELACLVSAFDIDLSQKAMQAMGDMAVRLPLAAPLVCQKLVSLLGKGISPVSGEAISVAKDILRKYTHLAPNLLPSLTQAARSQTVEGSVAKVSLVWILGQFGTDIPDAPYLLEEKIDAWEEEDDPAVRCELLTAAVKLFYARPPEMQHMLGRLFQTAIADASNVDVHDRALFYYRLMTADPEEARHVIFGGDVTVDRFLDEGGPELHDQLLEAFGTLSVLYGMAEDRWLPESEASAAHTMTDPSVTSMQAAIAQSSPA